MHKVLFLVLLVLLVSLAACGGGASPAPSGGNGGAAAEGKTVFNQVASPPCSSCHSIEAGVTLVGPSLAGIGSAAGTIESGTSAEEYLKQSIVDPNAYITPGFGGNIMPASYGTQLTEKQINDLVAYLMTLK
jgi:mono/diheme cytochrome c family protein